MTNPNHELKELKKILTSTQTQLRELIQRHNSQMKQLRTQKKTLQSHITELEDELAESRADNDGLVLRCEELEYKNWSIFHSGDVIFDENYVLRVEREGLVAERRDLIEEKRRLVEEKECLVEEKEVLVVEKEVLVVEKEVLVVEKERLVEEKEQLLLENQELENSLDQAKNEKSEAKKSAKKHETINITLTKELKSRGKKYLAQKQEWRIQKQEFITQKTEWETEKNEFIAEKQEWESYEDKLRAVVASLDKKGWDLLTTLFAFGKSDDKVWVGKMDEKIVGMVGESGEMLEMIFERRGGMRRCLLDEVVWEAEDEQVGPEDEQTHGVNGDLMMAGSEEDL
ncbi:6f400d19-f63e-4bea-8768-1132c355b9a0-CDS [Sclerotinia trifoliorum]|uniref:6f400d19-f63e-4bea-8768-1132c355b9a0-CDS n=1 Tax=Sclerotinia trifoliorum TaxID=28548 RepID=A0A8H2W476_9HELO|nr:6f400d19-f63e-4bea-8768-1132c355b9a0-CDS [Sclerotinia trifoliorum]